MEMRRKLVKLGRNLEKRTRAGVPQGEGSTYMYGAERGATPARKTTARTEDPTPHMLRAETREAETNQGHLSSESPAEECPLASGRRGALEFST